MSIIVTCFHRRWAKSQTQIVGQEGVRRGSGGGLEGVMSIIVTCFHRRPAKSQTQMSIVDVKGCDADVKGCDVDVKGCDADAKG